MTLMLADEEQPKKGEEGEFSHDGNQKKTKLHYIFHCVLAKAIGMVYIMY